jgi:hypothetical protein
MGTDATFVSAPSPDREKNCLHQMKKDPKGKPMSQAHNNASIPISRGQYKQKFSKTQIQRSVIVISLSKDPTVPVTRLKQIHFRKVDPRNKKM